MAEPSILLIGAGKWQVPLFERARALGLEVVATHAYANDAPAFALSDHSYVLDARDKNGHLEVAKRHHVSGVVTGADIAVPTAAFVATALGLPTISEETARAATDKAEMRRRAQQIGLAVPRFLPTRSEEEGRAFARQVGFPTIVKPIDGWGSRGVTVVADETRFHPAWEEALRFSSGQEVLVEELLHGAESSVEGFVDGRGRFHVLGISEKMKSELPYRFDLELHYPARFAPEQLAAIELYVTRLIEGFDITMGLTHTEVMVAGNSVHLIETAARGCGAFVVSKLLPAMTGLPIVDAVIRQAMGETVEIGDFTTRHGLLRFMVAPPGTVKRIEGLEQARAIPGIIDLEVDLQPGWKIAPATNTKGRTGHLLAIGDSREEVDQIAREAIHRLRVEMEP